MEWVSIRCILFPCNNSLKTLSSLITPFCESLTTSQSNSCFTKTSGAKQHWKRSNMALTKKKSTQALQPMASELLDMWPQTQASINISSHHPLFFHFSPIPLPSPTVTDAYTYTALEGDAQIVLTLNVITWKIMCTFKEDSSRVNILNYCFQQFSFFCYKKRMPFTLSAELTLAPCRSSALTTSACPLPAAQMIGVTPCCWETKTERSKKPNNRSTTESQYKMQYVQMLTSTLCERYLRHMDKY